MPTCSVYFSRGSESPNPKRIGERSGTLFAGAPNGSTADWREKSESPNGSSRPPRRVQRALLLIPAPEGVQPRGPPVVSDFWFRAHRGARGKTRKLCREDAGWFGGRPERPFASSVPGNNENISISIYIYIHICPVVKSIPIILSRYLKIDRVTFHPKRVRAVATKWTVFCSPLVKRNKHKNKHANNSEGEFPSARIPIGTLSTPLNISQGSMCQLIAHFT